jgi:hypothetical protein
MCNPTRRKEMRIYIYIYIYKIFSKNLLKGGGKRRAIEPEAVTRDMQPSLSLSVSLKRTLFFFLFPSPRMRFAFRGCCLHFSKWEGFEAKKRLLLVFSISRRRCRFTAVEQSMALSVSGGPHRPLLILSRSHFLRADQQ